MSDDEYQAIITRLDRIERALKLLGVGPRITNAACGALSPPRMTDVRHPPSRFDKCSYPAGHGGRHSWDHP